MDEQELLNALDKMIDAKLAALEARMDVKIDAKLEAKLQPFTARFNALSENIDRLAVKFFGTIQGLEDLERKTDNLIIEIDDLKQYAKETRDAAICVGERLESMAGAEPERRRIKPE